VTVARVLHPIVIVEQLDRAIDFYATALGFTVTQRWRHDPEKLAALTGTVDPDAEAAILAAPDGTELELVQVDRPRPARPLRRWNDMGLSMISLGVGDLDTTTRDIERAGGRVAGEPVIFGTPPASSRVVYASDRDGIGLCLVEAPG
jgi:predicted enzyme related to lactoylglutathione lyase